MLLVAVGQDAVHIFTAGLNALQTCNFIQNDCKCNMATI